MRINECENALLDGFPGFRCKNDVVGDTNNPTQVSERLHKLTFQSIFRWCWWSEWRASEGCLIGAGTALLLCIKPDAVLLKSQDLVFFYELAGVG